MDKRCLSGDDQMPDYATSEDPRVQRQLNRLERLAPDGDTLGLERIRKLLGRLGDPQRHLPPVFHVAGTNGKGSTCAFLRAAIESAGLAVHVYSSPHLVRFNERIRIGGELVSDAQLADLLSETLDHAGDIGASFFEVTTAAALLAFSRAPAAACIIEVGLGGRLDATNVISRPAACGIAQLGLDHEAFLGSTAEAIAAEKAGIAKPGSPLVTMEYPASIRAVIMDAARHAGAELRECGSSWTYAADERGVWYQDDRGSLMLGTSMLAGGHQAANLALAAAMLRHQSALAVPDTAIVAAAGGVRWPARMQRLGKGPLTASFGERPVWLDGGHNPAAGTAIAAALAASNADAYESQDVTMIAGMLANKDAMGFLTPLVPLISRFIAVPVAGHDHHHPEALAEIARRAGVADAVSVSDLRCAIEKATAGSGPIFIGGSLYLAGKVLRENDEVPV